MICLPIRTSILARLLAASAPFFIFATSADAQDQAPTGQAVDGTVGGQVVGDIVVTATRRPESSKDVPLAVTAISGEKLDVLNSSGLDIRFLAGRTPSLQVNPRSAALSRVSISAVSATPISILTPLSRCRWCTTTLRSRIRC